MNMSDECTSLMETIMGLQDRIAGRVSRFCDVVESRLGEGLVIQEKLEDQVEELKNEVRALREGRDAN